MSDINTISQSGDLLRNIDVGEMLRLREQMADLQRELEQERQDRKQADLDTIRALGERNDARTELEQIKAILTNPLAVHLNMMRGTIKWTPANLRHLLGDLQTDTEQSHQTKP